MPLLGLGCQLEEAEEGKVAVVVVVDVMLEKRMAMSSLLERGEEISQDPKI